MTFRPAVGSEAVRVPPEDDRSTCGCGVGAVGAWGGPMRAPPSGAGWDRQAAADRGGGPASCPPRWPTAATYQRELREMFGIDFPGSPRIEEEFILEGWNDIPPYRRDFDTLKYAEASYNQRPGRETRDPATHMKQQLYPDTVPGGKP